jgi:hypothetical protein
MDSREHSPAFLLEGTAFSNPEMSLKSVFDSSAA